LLLGSEAFFLFLYSLSSSSFGYFLQAFPLRYFVLVFKSFFFIEVFNILQDLACVDVGHVVMFCQLLGIEGLSSEWLSYDANLEGF
jgi:hypothetical protein